MGNLKEKEWNRNSIWSDNGWECFIYHFKINDSYKPQIQRAQRTPTWLSDQNKTVTKKKKTNQPFPLLQVSHLDISYSNCRWGKTKRKSWKKLVGGYGKSHTYRETRLRIIRISNQKPCKQESRMKYVKCWLQHPPS